MIEDKSGNVFIQDLSEFQITNFGEFKELLV